jgi:parvulin-like peptidyl-prolyl isomerase
LKRVVRQQLLQQNLQTAVTSDPAAAAAAKQQAQDVVSKLKGGADFATLAKQDSQGSDASSGGDMGSFTKAQVPAAVWAAVSALQAGQVSDPVKVSGGYVVLKVVTKNSDGSIHAQEILINTVDFNTYMQQKIKAAKVNTYLKV